MLNIRQAGFGDGALIFQFIYELAEYEKLAHEVSATPELIEEMLTSVPPRTQAVIAEMDGNPVGMALYFYNFSTFLGRPGIYIEDLFVRPEHRGEGIGRALLSHLAHKAVKEGCGRLEWWVLDWNAPSIAFYEKLGAKPMNEWTVMRVDGEALTTLAAA